MCNSPIWETGGSEQSARDLNFPNPTVPSDWRKVGVVFECMIMEYGGLELDTSVKY